MSGQPPASTATVTIAVVSWNTRDLLADCLESLRHDANEGLAEVWVVDNASADGSAELVNKNFPWVKLIASTENLGFGTAVNRVAARTTTPWLVAANADIRVTPGAVQMLVAEGDRHRNVAALAPRLRLPDGSTQHSVYPFPTVPFTVANLSGVTRVSPRLARHWCIGKGLDPSVQREVPWAVGAFLLLRRTAWDEVGGFDEAQWMYAEDLDLGWRLSRAGWRTLYVPAAEVWHAESSATTQAWGNNRYARWHASTYAWLLRRRGLPYARLLAALNVTVFLGRATIVTPAVLAGSGRARAARQNAMYAVRDHSLGLRPRRFLENVR